MSRGNERKMYGVESIGGNRLQLKTGGQDKYSVTPIFQDNIYYNKFQIYLTTNSVVKHLTSAKQSL